jgi:PTS system nitrogen regulatory IIA component
MTEMYSLHFFYFSIITHFTVGFQAIIHYRLLSFFGNRKFHFKSEIMETFDKWLTLEDLATYLKLSKTKLYGMAQRGDIPASKIGNQWRFDREEIDQWMKTHATSKGEAKK